MWLMNGGNTTFFMNKCLWFLSVPSKLTRKRPSLKLHAGRTQIYSTWSEYKLWNKWCPWSDSAASCSTRIEVTSFISFYKPAFHALSRIIFNFTWSIRNWFPKPANTRKHTYLDIANCYILIGMYLAACPLYKKLTFDFYSSRCMSSLLRSSPADADVRVPD